MVCQCVVNISSHGVPVCSERLFSVWAAGGGVSGVLGEGVQPDLHALWAYRHL